MKNPMITIFAVLMFGVVTLLLPLSAGAEAETYMIDKVHSMANFKIRHLFSKVTGTFSDVTGTIWIDPENLEKSKVEATINVYSVDTNHQKRDAHLRSKDFFDVDKYPLIQFVTTSPTFMIFYYYTYNFHLFLPAVINLNNTMFYSFLQMNYSKKQESFYT